MTCNYFKVWWNKGLINNDKAQLIIIYQNIKDFTPLTLLHIPYFPMKLSTMTLNI